jgi:hypothetical protein
LKVPVSVWSIHVQNVKWSEKIVWFLVTWFEWCGIKELLLSLFSH